MKIYIDQSGKVEYTSHHTVVAFSNGKNKAIHISAAEKRKLQSFFRQAGKPNIFIFKSFAVLIYLLIKGELESITDIVIDMEYKGRNSVIKKYLVELVRKGGDKFDPACIHFGFIGKKNPAHKKAIAVFRKKESADLRVKSSDLIQWIL